MNRIRRYDLAEIYFRKSWKEDPANPFPLVNFAILMWKYKRDFHKAHKVSCYYLPLIVLSISKKHTKLQMDAFQIFFGFILKLMHVS
jgi:hypothetical protein